MFQIRIMQPEDYDQVYALWMSCAGMGLNDLDDSEDGICRYLKRNPGLCFVAEEGTELIGAILSGHDGRRGYIYHTAVAPAWQRQGVGTKLVDAAITAMRSAGINKTALVVFARNKTGNSFWERMGFTSREDILYRNKTLTEMRRIDT